jgi:hypothetical protein
VFCVLVPGVLGLDKRFGSRLVFGKTDVIAG